VAGDDTVGLDSLAITTNDDTTLRVIGRRSDDSTWMDIKTEWVTSEGLVTDPAAPEKSHSWTFSPSTPGTGWISVTLNNDSTQLDSIWVDFAPGPVTNVSFTITTPPEERQAGVPISGVISISNENGLFPGDTSFAVRISDLLGDGGRDSLPRIIVDGQDYPLDSLVNLTFNNGIDSIDIVLYYVPENETDLHELVAEVGDVEGHTDPFSISPGPLTRLVMETSEGDTLPPDTTLRSPREFLYIFSAGYDGYGNRLGHVISNWTILPYGNENPLHPLTRAEATKRIYYGTDDVEFDEHGSIRAEHIDSATICDTLRLTVLAPPAGISEAITRDTDGNGFLDRIDVSFTKFVTLDADSLSMSLVGESGSLEWGIRYVLSSQGDTLMQGDTLNDTSFTLILQEQETSDAQTSLTPLLTMAGIADVDSQAVHGITTIDGAGPVIWRVELHRSSSETDRRDDVVIVRFSEDITGGNGTFNIVNDPGLVFTVWIEEDDSLVEVAGFLDGIENFNSQIEGDNILKFNVQNNGELTSEHFFNITVYPSHGDSNYHVLDKAEENPPVEDNKKVRVVVRLATIRSLSVGPNPARATYTGGTELTVTYTPSSQQTRPDAESVEGVYLAFPLFVYTGEEPDEFDVTIKVYDMAGNLVNSAELEKVIQNGHIPAHFFDGGIHNYSVFWNGLNAKGMKVSPGIYRIIMDVDYIGSRVKDQVYTGNVGIRY